MLLFTILITILAIAAAVVLAFTGVLGGAALVVFGDVIVFVLIVMLLVKIFKK